MDENYEELVTMIDVSIYLSLILASRTFTTFEVNAVFDAIGGKLGKNGNKITIDIVEKYRKAVLNLKGVV
ncbi:unnamed protein product [marine sediment metagenome]|uniref:Uncharacterized protein n=1 Tax=marine sediment metagenome TaxID=412755 RepID=X0XFD2_9ZZZZ